MSDFELFLCCLLAPLFWVFAYTAGRLNLLEHFFESAAENVSLTLEQLKESMGEPLWLVDEADQWISIVEVDSDRIWFTAFGDDQNYFLWTSSYGNVCQIYRRKP